MSSIFVCVLVRRLTKSLSNCRKAQTGGEEIITGHRLRDPVPRVYFPRVSAYQGIIQRTYPSQPEFYKFFFTNIQFSVPVNSRTGFLNSIEQQSNESRKSRQRRLSYKINKQMFLQTRIGRSICRRRNSHLRIIVIIIIARSTTMY